MYEQANERVRSKHDVEERVKSEAAREIKSLQATLTRVESELEKLRVERESAASEARRQIVQLRWA